MDNETLIRMDEKLTEIQETCKKMEKRLFGNGNEGLIVTVAKNKDTIKNIKWGLGLGFTALGVLITLMNIF